MCALSFTKVSLIMEMSLHLEHKYSELRVPLGRFNLDVYEVSLLVFFDNFGLAVDFIRY